jgi:hypothetical protein
MTTNKATVLPVAARRPIWARAFRLTTTLPICHPSFAGGFPARTVGRRSMGCRAVAAPLAPIRTFAVVLGMAPTSTSIRIVLRCEGHLWPVARFDHTGRIAAFALAA